MRLGSLSLGLWRAVSAHPGPGAVWGNLCMLGAPWVVRQLPLLGLVILPMDMTCCCAATADVYPRSTPQCSVMESLPIPRNKSSSPHISVRVSGGAGGFGSKSHLSGKWRSRIRLLDRCWEQPKSLVASGTSVAAGIRVGPHPSAEASAASASRAQPNLSRGTFVQAKAGPGDHETAGSPSGACPAQGGHSGQSSWFESR